MTTITQEACGFCGADLRDEVEGQTYSRRVGAEYAFDDPLHYDGISEWQCPDCGARVGRWSGRKLNEGEGERPFGGKR